MLNVGGRRIIKMEITYLQEKDYVCGSLNSALEELDNYICATQLKIKRCHEIFAHYLPGKNEYLFRLNQLQHHSSELIQFLTHAKKNIKHFLEKIKAMEEKLSEIERMNFLTPKEYDL